jgi:RNA polymerase sigma-70 factor (ECF subfamily)
MSAALVLAPSSALRALIAAAGRAGLAAPTAHAVGREAARVDEQDLADARAALDGDGPAFGRIVARHQQAVARQLSRFARDSGTREQLVADTFVEAWQSLAGWSGTSPLGAWLRTIATRVGYRHWREQARVRDVRDADDPRLAEALARAAGPSPDPSPREAAELLAALLARLAPRDRLVLTLLYWDGCSTEEAAALTGWSRTMVKVQAFRARRRLEKLLPDGLRPEGRRPEGRA